MSQKGRESRNCPTCGVLKMAPFDWPDVDDTPWSDSCACGNERECFYHTQHPDEAPRRPSMAVLEKRAEARLAKEKEEFEQLKAKFRKVKNLEQAYEDLKEAFAEFVRDCELVNNHHNHDLLIKAYKALDANKPNL